ncbi:MAG: glycosyl transferase, partial [Microcystis panniformis]
MLTKIYNNKIFRFLIAGGVAFLINLFLIYWLIDNLGFNTPILE